MKTALPSPFGLGTLSRKLAMAAIGLSFAFLTGCVSDTPKPPDAFTVVPSATSSSLPSYCLAQGIAARSAGDLRAAYLWYRRGAQFNAPTPSEHFIEMDLADTYAARIEALSEPERGYAFNCVISLLKICEERIRTNPMDSCEPVGGNPYANPHDNTADTCIKVASDIINARGGSYQGYNIAQMNAMFEEENQTFAAGHQSATASINQQRADANATAIEALSAINTGVSEAQAIQASRSSAGAGYAGGNAASASMANSNAQAAISQCSQNGAYKAWTSRCQTNNNGANQGPCYCAAAALLRCYISAAPNDPSVGQWRQDYQQNLSSAQSVGERCFNN